VQYSGGIIIGLHARLGLSGDKGIASGIIIGVIGLSGNGGAEAICGAEAIDGSEMRTGLF
tara:strand:- start:1002 stop:1181 length:180 start_codon:yes stop_codon:yes gene_type:complete